MRKLLLLLVILTGFACKRALSHTELNDELKKAMLNYLQHQDSYDSSKMKFQVLDVTYFEDRKIYDCDFTVKLTQNGHDTTGVMYGTISKDFSIVHRRVPK